MSRQKGNGAEREVALVRGYGVGQVYGRLKIVAFERGGKNSSALCECACGSSVRVRVQHLGSGAIKSCGCLARSANGASTGKFAREYRIWKGMHARCTKMGRRFSHRYVGRGIKVVRRWSSFELFLMDMGAAPSAKHSVERENNDGNYSPSNCVWATQKQQGLNMSTNRRLDWDGKRLCITQWAEVVGIERRTIARRLALGWSVGDALTRPLRKKVLR